MQPGDVFDGKFRIERMLGRGGMGVVAVATHLALDQKVAIKVLHERVASDANGVERLVREARASARLRSEHVCRVFDVGNVNGRPYIVMELLEGADLASVIERKPLPIKTAVDYVLQACVAIAEAHALGIVHRDLKPANLFVTRRFDGAPLIKVLDFGIAKAPSTTSVALTQTETMMGTPGYMSPEQLRSARDVDQRTDIWALGVILYQAVSGRLPFPANSITEAAVKIAIDPPEPLDVDPAFRAIVLRCLEKDPAKRYRDVAALARAAEPFGGASATASAAIIDQLLVNVATASTVLATPLGETKSTTLEGAAGQPSPSRSRGGRAAIAIGGLLAASGIALAVWSKTRSQPASPAPVVVAAATPDAALADASIVATPIEAVDAPLPAAPAPASKPTAKKQRPTPIKGAEPTRDAPPDAMPAAPLKGEADLDRALARHRCSEAWTVARELERNGATKDVAARLNAKVQACHDQRTAIMQNITDPAAEPWLLASVDELRGMGKPDDARLLYDNFYYGRTIHACTNNDAKAARIAFAKVSAADRKKAAIDYCKTKQITVE